MEFLGSVQGILTTIAAAVAGIVGTIFAFKGKRGDQQVQARQITEESTSKFLDGQMEFQKYVDEAVRIRVEEATAEMRSEIAEMSSKLTSVQSEYTQMMDVMSSRETRLWIWNHVHEKKGPMPELPEAVMHRLNVGHLINLSATFPDSGKMDAINDKE